jgi:hypothetical protein
VGLQTLMTDLDMRNGYKGGCIGFSCEVKKKEENYAVFYFAGKRFFFYIYEVFTSPEKEKRSNVYLP